MPAAPGMACDLLKPLPGNADCPSPSFQPHRPCDFRCRRMLQTVHLYIFEGFADWEPAFA